MADLTEIQSSQAVKVAGANPSTGVEDNFMEVDTSGRITVRINDGAGTSINVGQTTMSASVPVVIASDQSTINVKASNFPTTVDLNYGTVGASTLRTASQIGNATGGADFAAGNSSAQTLRIVVATNQAAIAVSQSGAWTVAATQSGTWTVQPGNTQNTTAWLTQDAADGPVTPGTVAAKSLLIGAQFNTALPTLTNGQQAALQADSSGRLITAPQTITVGVADKTTFTYGTTSDVIVGGVFQDTSPTLTAGQSGAVRLTTNRAFHINIRDAAGNEKLGSSTSVNSIPVVVASDQGAIPVSQSGTWTTGRTWTLASGTDSVAAVQSGTWTVQPGNTANTTPWLVTDSSDGTVVPGTVAGKSSLAGGQFNTALPTLTNTQQAALQVDSSGRLIIAPLTSTSTTTAAEDHNYGTVGATTLRTASQLGNATGAALFGAGTTTAQVLRVVLPTDQTAIPATQSGTWTVQPGNTANTTAWLVAPTSDGPVTPGTVATKSNLIGGQYNTASPAPTNGQQVALQVDSSGKLLVNTTGNVSSTPTDIGGSGTITSLGGAVTSVIHGCATIAYNITGTWVASLTIEATVDGGTNWFPAYAFFQPFDLYTNNLSASQAFVVECGGFQQVRIRAAAYTSGTVAIAWNACAGTNANVTYCFNPTPGNFQEVPNAYQTTSFAPDPKNVTTFTLNALNQDAGGNLQVRGNVLTDEDSLRDDFSGAALTTTLTGTMSFTNGSTVVNGSGTLFASQVAIGQYIKINSDAETAYAQVASINSDVSLNLETNYTGSTNGAATAVVSNWKTSTGTGTSMTVGSSLLNLLSGTTNGSSVNITRAADYGPLSIQFFASITQRIANQTSIIGFVDSGGANAAVVQFTGATNTTVNFITAFSSAAADTQTTAVTLPNGGTTNTSHQYVIDLSAEQATLSIDGVVCAVNLLHIPSPYSVLTIEAGLTNSAVVTTTTLAIDSIYYQDVDRLQVMNDFAGEPIPVSGAVSSGQTDSGGPVKIGGVFNTALPTLSTGQRGDIQLDSSARLIIAPLPTGANTIGTVNVGTLPTLTKGTQGSTGFTVQDLKDAGRNQTNYFMAAQIVSTATDALMSLTGYKSNAAVGATTTPAVVTTGKTYRLNSITMDYTTIITTPGSVRFTLRANTGGVVAITSAVVCTWEIGEPTGIAPVAGKKNTVTIPIPDGMEFAAGTGIGISMVGLNTTGGAAAVGYGRITLNGFEY